MGKKKTNDGRGLIIISVIVLIAVVGLWSITYILLRGDNETDRGTFGDMFGGINALFSGLAFGGIIITILLQRKELSLQRQELEETRIELRRTADAQDAQNNFLLSQQYQTTFFSLLSGHTTLINSLSIHESRGFEGLAAFYYYILNETELYDNRIKDKLFPTHKSTSNNPVHTLQNTSEFFDSIFGDLITLIKFIDGKLSDGLYYEILYNHLSVYEKYLIGLYCDCFDDDYSEFINGHKYKFKKYYESQNIKYKLGPDTYFPEVSITRMNITNLFLADANPTSKYYDFFIHLDQNFYPDSLSLQKVVVHGYSVDHNGVNIVKFSKLIEDGSFVIKDSAKEYQEVHLMPYVYGNFSDIDKGHFHIDFEFVFKYKLKSYTVQYKTIMHVGETLNPSGFSDKLFSTNHQS